MKLYGLSDLSEFGCFCNLSYYQNEVLTLECVVLVMSGLDTKTRLKINHLKQLTNKFLSNI